jgi:TusA-related sulfurtransferase
MPIVRVSQVIKTIASGDRLVITATDSAFQADLEAWARKAGHCLVAFERGPVQQAIIEKA